MRRVLRFVVIGALILALGIDPATACHFLRSRCGGGGWGAGYCGAPADYAGPCNGVIIDGDGSCSSQGYGYGGYQDGYAVDACCEGGTVIESGQPIYEGESHQSAPAEPAPAPAETFRPTDEEPAPMLPPDPMPAQPDAPATDDDLLTPPPQATTPPPTTPAETTPPAEAPVTSPTETEDDLFGPSTEPVVPNETPAAPATESEAMQDFFDSGPIETVDPAALPADDLPVVDPTALPPTEAPTVEPSETDLFGEPPATESEIPAATPPVVAPTDEAVEELGMDELDINEEPAPPADDGAPAESEEPPAAEEDSDLFDFGAILREPGGLDSNEMREWVDNTGQYSCNARLVRFLDGQVRLLKENGHTTTLPLYRLSENDLQFVHRQASAQRAEVIGQTVQSGTMLPWLAN